MPRRSLPLSVACFISLLAAALLLPVRCAFAETWALLIGVDSYDSSEITPLHGAVNDVLALKQTLIDTGLCKAENITLLVTRTGNKRPDRGSILEETDNLQVRIHKGDTVFVFFSGHGCQSENKTYLLSCDVRTSSIPTVKRTAVDVDDFEDALHRLPDARVIIAYDMCRVEIGKDGSTIVTPQMQGKGQDFTVSPAKPDTKLEAAKTAGPVLVRWWSCSPGERSYEVKTESGGQTVWRGYFSSVLERGLKGEAATEGKVTLASLARYVHDTVADEVKRQQSRAQQPRLLLDIGSPDDVTNFVLGERKAVIAPGAGSGEEAMPPSGNLAPTRINGRDGAEMILIPAGEFLMGDDDLENWEHKVTNPRHMVHLSAYYIYKNLVTVGQYEKFCQVTGRHMPDAPNFNANWGKKDHPMVNVSWEDATAYCNWAGVKLPTEAQWEKAARGTHGNKYPWGDAWDADKLWCSRSKRGDAGGPTAVGSFPTGKSPYGVQDMAGNVWQWCQDWYDESSGEKERVLRGGSWYIYESYVFRAAYRFRFNPTERRDGLGFRACVAP